jgi:type II secretion system protein L
MAVVPEYHLSDLVSAGIKTNGLNLLQGRYASKKHRFRQTKKTARIMRVLAIVWLALLLAYPVVSYLILSQRVNAVQTQIAAIYHREFPNATSVVAPKLRMEEKLHQVTSQLGSNKFLLLSGYVGKGVQATPAVNLKRMQFQNNRLTLEVSAPSAADFSAFTQYLSNQGLSVKQQNANISGARVSAIVEVE